MKMESYPGDVVVHVALRFRKGKNPTIETESVRHEHTPDALALAAATSKKLASSATEIFDAAEEILAEVEPLLPSQEEDEARPPELAKLTRYIEQQTQQRVTIEKLESAAWKLSWEGVAVFISATEILSYAFPEVLAEAIIKRHAQRANGGLDNA